MIRKKLGLAALLLGGFLFFPLSSSRSQSVDPEAAGQVQKLSQQSQKLLDEYKTKKKALEAQLQEKLKTLTNSPADRLRRRQWMEETNQRLRQLQEDFNVEIDSLQEAKNKLIHPGDEGSMPVRAAPRPRAISDEELKERIKRQDELFRQEDERWNPAPREKLPVENNAVENNPQPPAVSIENSSQQSPPRVLFPPAPPSDKEVFPKSKSSVNAY